MYTADRVFVRRVLKWGRDNRRQFPWREETDPFRILIAELMLQRSRGKTVANVYSALFSRWKTPRGLARARQEEIADVIRPIGLTRRAATIKSLARAVVARGGVPESVEELIELPGIGRYAAHATAAVAYGHHVAAVDSVTERVYRRYFGLPSLDAGGQDSDAWNVATQVTPKRDVREWNWAVLDLAAAVCLPKIPRCHECPLIDACRFVQP